MTTKTYLISLLITICLSSVAAIFIYRHFQKPQVIEVPVVNPVKPPNPIIIEKPVFVIKPGKPIPVNIDSLFQVAKEYWRDSIEHDTVYLPQKPANDYIASADTTINNGLLKLRTDFVSRLPLDPEGLFLISFEVYCPEPPKQEESSWWYRRFGVYAGVGPTYGLIHKKFDVGLNLSFGMRIY